MKIIRNILAIIGSIYLLLTLFIVIFIIFKPYGINIIKVIPAVLNENQKSSYDHPNLTTQQELLLESVGINPKDVPTEITPTQQQCGIAVLGEKRANEITAGSTPTVSEIIKLKSCLSVK